MLELSDTPRTVEVRDAEYHRLLGFPPRHDLTERAQELAAWARSWYREHGTPWWYARQIDRLGLAPDGGITMDGITFSSTRLHDTLREAGAESAIVMAVSAGPECEDHARRLWDEGKPDEYLFLEVFGSAVVEALVAAAAYRLCAWADEQGLAVLPHYSPGYPAWDIADQQALLDHVAAGRGYVFGGRLRVRHTGMLQPKKSLLAVFGITRHLDRVRRLTSLVPCENCSLAGCRYRRAPYRHPLPQVERLRPDADAPPPTTAPAYTLSATALEKWSRQRLEVHTRPDRTVEARFRYEGTTCSNMGWPLAFDYHVHLSPAEHGYTILDARCAPARDDQGHQYMCEYLLVQEALLETIASERPLLGRPLEDVLQWRRESNPAGCYCDADARTHKWGIALEVLHYALARSAPQSTGR